MAPKKPRPLQAATGKRTPQRSEAPPLLTGPKGLTSEEAEGILFRIKSGEPSSDLNHQAEEVKIKHLQVVNSKLLDLQLPCSASTKQIIFYQHSETHQKSTIGSNQILKKKKSRAPQCNLYYYYYYYQSVYLKTMKLRLITNNTTKSLGLNCRRCTYKPSMEYSATMLPVSVPAVDTRILLFFY